MRWNRVCIETIAYELPEERILSSELETRLAPVYDSLRLSPGQLEALTGIVERRVWPRGTAMSAAATLAGKKALETSGVSANDLGALIYTGVCRDDLEPATACAVADSLGLPEVAMVYDIANACLGMLNGIIDIANRIELGQIRAGMVVAAESSRAIVDSTIERMLGDPTLDTLRLCLATLTGGSGAAAIVLTDESISRGGHRLLGGASLSAPVHHRLCRWGPTSGLLGETPNVANTDASAILANGVGLGKRTFDRFLHEMEWQREDIERVICHQVGGGNRRAILGALGIDGSRDFSTFPHLGNMGTVALPSAAAIAAEQGFLRPGDQVAFLGIGSGLSCMMLGLSW